jgi:hypothetical protein
LVSGGLTFTPAAIANAAESVSCVSLAACMDNVGTSPDSNQQEGGLDGANSISATDLATAGWHPGGRVTVNGGTFALPQFGSGKADNVLAANQIIANTDPALAAYNSTVPANDGSVGSLMFLATATNTPAVPPNPVNGDATAPQVPAGTRIAASDCSPPGSIPEPCLPIGTVTYTNGGAGSYFLGVPDWLSGPSSLASVVLPHENTPGGQLSGSNPRIYTFSVPLAPGEQIASVSLPSTDPSDGYGAIHIFGMATRSNLDTAGAPAGQTWTGAWAGATEGSYRAPGQKSFTDQTFRVAVKPAISGGTVRIKLDNALGTGRLPIGHVTIAAAMPGTAGKPPSARPAATPVSLTFGGQRAVTIPAGGMVYSDPLPFAVTSGKDLLVSFDLAGTVPSLVEHTLSTDAYEYIAAAGSGDRTTDTTGVPFSGPGAHSGSSVNLVTGVDVATAGAPTLAVLGDGLIDASQPNARPDTAHPDSLATELAAAEPSSNPVGTIGEGIESNQLSSDHPQTTGGSPAGGPSILSRVDRDILDQPNLKTVVIYEGLQDLLAGQTAVKVEYAYNDLLTYLEVYGVNAVMVGATPCDGYGGGGGTPDDPCTPQVDGNRSTVNSYLADNTADPYVNPDSAIGVVNPADNGVQLAASADNGDHVNFTNSGYAALAHAVLPQMSWGQSGGRG